MQAGSRSVIPGWTNKLISLSYRFTPRTSFLPLARAAQSEQVRRALGVRGSRPPRGGGV